MPSKIEDALRLCNNSSSPKFVGFLTPQEVAVAEVVAKKQNCKVAFFGGYDDAERQLFGAFPEWCESFEELFPIKALTFTYRKGDMLSHRHFLGTFMSLGIARETVGDILVGEGRAVAFFSEEMARYVKSQINKISNTGVTVEEGFCFPLPGMSAFEEISDTVASTRLDCIVASLIKSSRGTATELIEDKMVSLNSVCCEKATKMVVSGDKITIRGKGKFIIDSVNMRSKKDRLILKAKKYI